MGWRGQETARTRFRRKRSVAGAFRSLAEPYQEAAFVEAERSALSNPEGVEGWLKHTTSWCYEPTGGGFPRLQRPRGRRSPDALFKVKRHYIQVDSRVLHPLRKRCLQRRQDKQQDARLKGSADSSGSTRSSCTGWSPGSGLSRAP
jgi:hypothetical protein